MKLRVNGRFHTIEPALAETPLLWVLRERLGLVGTRFGCGIGACGACTVHVDGAAQRSCQVPCGKLGERAVTTIEGLAAPGGTLHAVQAAWLEERVAQCGFCQGGQIMSAAALLAVNPAPTDADIDVAMEGNLCRCGTYPRIRRAIHRAAAALAAPRTTDE